MKGSFVIFLASFCLNVFCMEKVVYFDTIHETNPSITARVSDEMKLVDSSLNEVSELTISSGEESGFEVFLRDGYRSGIVSVYDSRDLDNVLLKFSIEKASSYFPAKVQILSVAPSMRSVLYRPSMGGGDNFVLLIGDKTSDFSIEKVQRSLPFGSIQSYTPVGDM